MMWPLRKKHSVTSSSSMNELASIIASYWGRSSTAGVNVNPANALEYDAVYTCVKILSEDISSLPLMTYQRKGDRPERATGLSVYGLLHDSPNEFQTAIEWRGQMIAHLATYGNSYNWIRRGLSGEPLELLPIAPNLVEVEQLPDWSIVYHVQQKEGGKKDYRASDILHVRGLTINGVVGISPIDCLKDTIGLGKSSETYQAHFFKNMAKPSGIIKLAKTLSSPEVVKRFKEKMKEAIAGNSQNDLLVLDEGSDYQQISLSSEDSELTLTRKMQRSAIAAAYRIPLYKLNEMDGAKYRNMEQSALEYVKWTLLPYLESIEQAMWKKLLTKQQQKEVYFEHKAENALRGDSKTRYESYALSIANGIMSPDDARRLENLPPRDDGLGGGYFYSANYLPAGTTQQDANEKRREALHAIT